MPKRYLAGTAVVLVILSLAGFGAWLLSLPATSDAAVAPPVPETEVNDLLASLRPPKRPRPLVAIVGLNDATETTDYLMPAGILRRADVADVTLLSTREGPVQLYPVLKVLPDATTAAFDAAHPEGADYVIVPAMSRDDDPAVLAWLQQQAGKGATIIGVCAGAKVVGAARLLDGKRATTHWYYVKELLTRSPSIRYVADRRIVSEAGVATTTGITASAPMMLTLIEAIAGRTKAEAVARDLGIAQWDTTHASAAFTLTRPFVTTVLRNRMAFWTHEELGTPLTPDMDEVSLALVADAWSRTYRSNVMSFAASADAVTTRNGVRLIPDRASPSWPEGTRITTKQADKPAEALDAALQAIAARYGARTTDIVAMQLEYPRATPR